MGLPKRYRPETDEPHIQKYWQEKGVYHFDPDDSGPVFSIDTPPPTVSGNLHLGHFYSYSQPDFFARFWRMNGHNVFYPMGYDDNGLPTERLVERQLGITAAQVGREAFIESCLQVSQKVEKEYRELWQRLGLSNDWRYSYRTIDRLSRKTSQLSFLDLYRRDLAYRQKAPTIWCPECKTAIAQAELDDLDRETDFVTLAFRRSDGESLPIATTRPELLPACVAVFVHPDDDRFKDLVSRKVQVPLFGQWVPLLQDPAAEPEKGTGAVMACTFGDVTDISWWYKHQLPLVETIGSDGRLTAAAGEFAGLSATTARIQIIKALEQANLLLGLERIKQSIRVHERCDTPVEYTVTPQWFIRILDFRDEFLDAGEKIQWHPPHMKARYRAWVENLHWDWCISRQRYFGVPFPFWYCDGCGSLVTADDQDVPIDPAEKAPSRECSCGSNAFSPETNVMDTWATSSLTPQIVGQWVRDESLYQRVFPMSLRPQAHEIIRTWAFYTIVKSYHHFGALPWKEIAISGWGLAPEGAGKISKSRGGGPIAPLEMLEKTSADAIRYWAACTGFGRDSIISEEKIQVGARLTTKLWNVARFSQRFLAGYRLPSEPPALSPADRWILSRRQRLVEQASSLFHAYDFAAAKNEIENFFWRELADNYLEMSKQRLYDDTHPGREGARFTLYHILLTIIKLLAPLLPHVTERIYLGLFTTADDPDSIHRSSWPAPDKQWIDETSEAAGMLLKEIATIVRRHKSERGIPLGTPLRKLQLLTQDVDSAKILLEAMVDITSVTRAQTVEIGNRPDPGLEMVKASEAVSVAILS